MSRIIRTQNNAINRKRALRLIQDAIVEYNNNIADIKDIAAYIVVLLEEIYKSVEITSAAWEKRDYWLKADRFRQEWRWAQEYKEQLIQVLNDENWKRVGEILIDLNKKIGEDSNGNNRKKKINYAGSWDRFKQLISKREK
ncbi:MAG: hypothetical protein ACPL3P_03655 [Anaerolineales bacterium]